MGFSRFRLMLTLHVLTICATSVLIAWVAANTSYYATLLVLGTVLALQMLSLGRYVESSHRALGRFLAAIRDGDFSQTFSPRGRGGTPAEASAGSFTELARAFDDVLQRFRDARTAREEQASYLNALVQHIPIAVVAFEDSGRVDLFNNAARRLLGTPGLRNVQDCTGLGETFASRLLALPPGQSQLIEAMRGDMPLEINAAATELRLSGRLLKIVTLQDIRRELEARELAAWQNLIRVLTHEIMNTVTPISSLANTATGLLDDAAAQRGRDPAGDLADARDAVDTIATRCAGLLRFADSYRRLTRIPTPAPQSFPVAELFARIGRLMDAEVARRGIRFSSAVSPPTLALAADADLLEQAMLNLVKNAIDAVADTPAAEIRLTAELGAAGQVLVDVADNGAGMPESVRENLFVPFYTTKRDGTGVGLSLVQQIMRAHHGSVSVHSSPGAGTRVRLHF